MVKWFFILGLIMNSIFYENVTIDITPDTIKLSYAAFEKTPEPKPPKSGFILKIKDGQSQEDFRLEGFKLLNEYLNKIQDGTFKEALKETLK